tara:strand:- start:4082 stop:5215 length:1134 start_codon:yes stop_codon:yes gene_type:complete
MKILFLTSNLGFFKTHFYESWIHGSWNNEGVVVSGKTGSFKIEKNIEEFFNKKNITFKKFNISGDISLNISEIINIYKLFKYLKKNDFDIIRTASPKFGLIGLIYAFFSKKKIVYMVSGVGYLGLSKNIFIKLLFFFINILLTFLLKHTKSFILTENTYDFNFWKRKKNKKYVKILCGAGVSEFYYKNNIKNKEKIILFPSRFLNSKGAYIFIQAANILKTKYPEWNFIMIGSDDYNNPHLIKKEILNVAKQNKTVKIVPYNEHVENLIISSSIMCLPTWREGKSKVLLEGAVAGCGIITNDVIGCNDVFINEKNSLLAKKDNLISLVHCIEKLINNENFLKKIQFNVKNNPGKKSNLMNIVSRTKKIYQEINDEFK